MKKLSALKLKELIVEPLSKCIEFSCNENILPFLCTIGEKTFYIYIKNVSSAYFSNSPDITRVQLPNHPDFVPILKSDIPFIMLGYDYQNDVLVSWNHHDLKKRLNEAKNISLYSRQSYQDEVLSDEFKFVYLTNGDKILIFKRQNIVKFLLNIDYLFSCEGDSISIDFNERSTNVIGSEFVVNDKLTKITDPKLIQSIAPYLKGYHMFQAVTMVMDYYADRFPKMTFKDWSPIVRKLKEDIK